MLSKRFLGAIVAILAVVCPSMSNADEQLVPLAQSGEWVAMAHKTSITSRPDVCIAFNEMAGIALREDADTAQFRVIDKRWSLPASVEGNILIAIGDWKLPLTISANTEDSVAAEMEQTEIAMLLTNMDKAATMAVTVGKAKPIAVSLAGSAKAANAFRTCAGIEGGSSKGGENPFK